MHNDPPDTEVRAFFDAFAAAFPSFDGEQIAQRYSAPYLSISASGASQLFSSMAMIADYFQGVLNQYREQGCVACQFRGLEVHEMGHNAVVGTVTWELLLQDGSVLTAWRESYHLVRTEGGLKARVSVDHAI